MKKTIFTLAILFAMAACDSVGQFREPIQNLASDWENATSQVSEFANNLQAQQQEHKSLMDNMQLSEEMKEKLGDAGMKTVQDMQAKLASYGNTYEDLGNQVEAFLSQWEEKGETLNSLQEGLESGSLPTDVQEKITSLKDMVANVEPTLSDWQTKLQATTQGVQSTAERYQSMLDEMMPKEDM